MPLQCTYTRQDEDEKIECKRRIDSGQVCILHDNRVGKDQNEFFDELKNTLENPMDTVVDLRGVVFVGGYELFTQQNFQRKVLFDFAEFVIKVPTFTDIQFSKEISFRGTKFFKGVVFKNCDFFAEANFKMAEFSSAEARFVKTRFHKNAVFSGAIFQSRTFFIDNCCFEKSADFSGTHVKSHMTIEDVLFKRGLNFDDSIIESSVRLTNVELSGKNLFTVKELKGNNFGFEKVKFLGLTDFDLLKFNSNAPPFIDCDLKEVRFLQMLDVDHIDQWNKPYIERCKWPRKKYWFVSGRKIVADEMHGADQHKLLKLYKYLHKKFYMNSEYQLALEFYVGFMIQKRKLQKGERLAKLLDGFYSLFSRYGESISRPFWALILMWLLVPILLLQLGIKLDTTDVIETKFPSANLTDYFRTVSLNIQLSTLVRSSELRPAITSWQSTILFFETVLNALFVGFFALGIRRRSVPKKPIE